MEIKIILKIKDNFLEGRFLYPRPYPCPITFYDGQHNYCLKM